MSVEQWFVVFTKVGAERQASENIERQGFAVYHPRLTRKSPANRGRLVALFPRYIFVRTDPLRRNLSPVRSTLGVVDIVRFGSQLAVVPDEVIADLMRRADPLTGLHSLHVPRIQPGASVTMTAGVFEGLEGVFQRRAGEDRIVVLLRLLGQEAQVRVPMEQVCPRAA